MNCEGERLFLGFFAGRKTVAPRRSREGKMSMTMVKSAPLASQEELMNGKTDVKIGISSVELAFVTGDSIGNGRWWKELSK